MDELWLWLTTLDREFLFLLALPFAVALAGFARLAFDSSKYNDDGGR